MRPAGKAPARAATIALGLAALLAGSLAVPSPAVADGVLAAAALPPGARILTAPAELLAGVDPAASAPSAPEVSTTLAAALGAQELGDAVAAQVIDVSTGATLLATSADRAAVPASTAKILTALAALSLLGADTTVATAVVDGASPAEIVLVGGGDVLLAPGAGDPGRVIGRAGLDDLAVATAEALTSQGRRTVALRVDDTLFPGPATNPAWRPSDVTGGFVAPVNALAMDAGNATPGRRPDPGRPFARAKDPAMAAAQAFAQRLRARGIAVTGSPTRSAAPEASAAPLAEVRSASVAELVEQSLTDSDNTVAEALARLVAHAGNYPATFAHAGPAVLAQVAFLGIPTSGQSMGGGSGLGTGYALRPATLVAALRLAASAEHPGLRAVLTGLPVAGASGTLIERFAGPAHRGALGMVRAKTGTLTGASSLAGTVVDADGRLLAFAVLADRVTSTDAARDGLDLVIARLAACGCR